MRPRPPGRLVTFQDITHDPPPPSSPTLDSYSVLDHTPVASPISPTFAPFLPLPTLPFPGSIVTIFNPFMSNSPFFSILLNPPLPLLATSLIPPPNLLFNLPSLQPSPFPPLPHPPLLHFLFIPTVHAPTNSLSVLTTPPRGESSLKASTSTILVQ